MQNKVFVDTDGNPLILGSMYLDEAENICTLDLIDNNSIIMEYLDQSIGRVTYYDFQVIGMRKSFVLIKLSSSVNKQPLQQGEVMQNELFVDTDGKPLTVGNVYVDHDGDTGVVKEVRNGCVLIFYEDFGTLAYGPEHFKCEDVFFSSTKERSTVTEPVNQNVGRKYDSGKPRYSLLPPLALEEVVHVLTFGSTKYEDFNWLKVENANDRYFSAANRHLWQWKRGEKLDDETKRHHLASAITNLMFILEMDLMDEQKQSVKE